MKCPQCGMNTLTVTESATNDKYVFRKRICKTCKAKSYSVEGICDGADERRARTALHRIKRTQRIINEQKRTVIKGDINEYK